MATLPGDDDCWEWMGRSAIGQYLVNHNGRRIRNKHKFSYGRIRSGGVGTPIIGAHIAAYIVTYGPVPPGKYICHTATTTCAATRPTCTPGRR
jgi:hypothetical protein